MCSDKRIVVDVYGKAIEQIKKTIETIDFAMQLSFALMSGMIKPEQLPTKILVGNGDDEYLVERDWSKYEEFLRQDFAGLTKIALASYLTIVCKESYARLFIKKEKGGFGLAWADKQTNFELYSAQMILKVVRNALGHMVAEPSTLEARSYWDFKDKDDKDRFEIKSIGVVLDTRDLQGKAFEWAQMGGIKNFKKVLEFLIKDLQKRIEAESA